LRIWEITGYATHQPLIDLYLQSILAFELRPRPLATHSCCFKNELLPRVTTGPRCHRMMKDVPLRRGEETRMTMQKTSGKHPRKPARMGSQAGQDHARSARRFVSMVHICASVFGMNVGICTPSSRRSTWQATQTSRIPRPADGLPAALPIDLTGTPLKNALSWVRHLGCHPQAAQSNAT
jgi:hypothetical protein